MVFYSMPSDFKLDLRSIINRHVVNGGWRCRYLGAEMIILAINLCLDALALQFKVAKEGGLYSSRNGSREGITPGDRGE